MHDDRILALFLAKIDLNHDSGCWLWTGEVTPKGYGRGRFAGQRIYAHRLAYELFVGPFPDGLVTDHLCRNRRCVNPAHLEPVTNAENVARGMLGRSLTHCKRGHEFTPENTYRYGGTRACRACARIRNRGRVRK